MKNKKRRLFLLVSFILFAFSVVAVISSIIVSYYEFKTDFPNPDIRMMNAFSFGVIGGMLIIVPSLGAELSFIRSVYKILKHNPKGSVKICYIVSSCLAFVAFAFLCLISFGLISFVDDRPNFTAEILLFTEWPAFILSFALGSIPIKHNN